MTKDILGDFFKRIEKLHETSVEGKFLIVRLDGKAFHTFTRGMQRPFDSHMTDAMDMTAYRLCRDSDIPVTLAYTQSDEISLLIENKGDPFFGGRGQKIASVAASYASAYFNDAFKRDKLGVFDARVFGLDESGFVERYFLWRKKDANRNAISALAQSIFPHKALQGKSKSDMLMMISQDRPGAMPIDSRNFNGAYYVSEVRDLPVEFVDKRTQRVETTTAKRRVWMRETDEHMLDFIRENVLD